MPSRNELLADHYLNVASIAAVYVEADGMIGTQDIVGIEIPTGRISFCCVRGHHLRLAGIALTAGLRGAPQAAVVNGPHGLTARLSSAPMPPSTP
jgi:hypothetical protein